MTPMLDFNDPDLVYLSEGRTDFPTTRAEAQVRLVELDDRIAAIRTEVGAADMIRQTGATLAPDSLHRARTALHHFQRERAELIPARESSGSGGESCVA